MKYVHGFLAELKAVFDGIASIPGPELKILVGGAVTLLASFGILHVANASALTNEVFAIVVILLAAGVAVEKALNGAAAYRASFKANDKPSTK
jgi:energy-converting hydrogenase Eha subunit C